MDWLTQRISAAAVGLIAALTLAGCSTGAAGGGPPPPFDFDADVRALTAELGATASIENYYQAAETEARRDAFVAARMSLIDLNYARFVGDLYANRALTDTTFDVSNVLVGVANTVVGGDQDRRILSAISAVLTGTRTSVEDAFFDGRTTDLLLAQMNSARTAAAVPIVRGLQRPLSEYPLSAALVDLQSYYIAGTIHGALMNSLQTASEQQAEAQAALDQYRSVSYASDASGDAMRRWLFPTSVGTSAGGAFVDASGQPAPFNAERRQALASWMETQGLRGMPIEVFLIVPDLAPTRQRAIAALGIPTS